MKGPVRRRRILVEVNFIRKLLEMRRRALVGASAQEQEARHGAAGLGFVCDA